VFYYLSAFICLLIDFHFALVYFDNAIQFNVGLSNNNYIIAPYRPTIQ